MDRERFDALARICATSSSRRAALAALLGTGLAGAIGDIEGKGKHRKNRPRGGARGAAKGAAVAAEATCASPGPSSNLSGCDFSGDDFSGDDLSGSRMVGTRFNNATLIETNLSSSNMKDATFRGSDLTCANLRSSTLKNADFRGFAQGNVTDLTGANLSSSACGGIQFNGRTRFCRTRMCNGAYNDADCPGGVAPEGFCCADADCPGDDVCVDRQCEPPPFCTAGNSGTVCVLQTACGDNCNCNLDLEGNGVCVTIAYACADCADSEPCGSGQVCVQATAECCASGTACVTVCPDPS